MSVMSDMRFSYLLICIVCGMHGVGGNWCFGISGIWDCIIV